MYFQYDESAIDYLKQKDQCLAEVIDKIRKIKREVNGVWFSSVTIFSVGIDRLQSFGMTVVTPVYTYTMTDRTEALANYNKYLEI
ncbi:hypothetical protein [Wansuia hejianensis]|uniref:Uncharacterized protein n=1 Tax=Wansuia hejianensis TaxID=2763667 RepID=A0A7G9GCN0_9FIRM|nr:hypothetical protein [Wansuia hejianensis]QNM08562.1 hypothetical protein H9Q79_17155 [Wansuia hejianensis]